MRALCGSAIVTEFSFWYIGSRVQFQSISGLIVFCLTNMLKKASKMRNIAYMCDVLEIDYYFLKETFHYRTILVKILISGPK